MEYYTDYEISIMVNSDCIMLENCYGKQVTIEALTKKKSIVSAIQYL